MVVYKIWLYCESFSLSIVILLTMFDTDTGGNSECSDFSDPGSLSAAELLTISRWKENESPTVLFWIDLFSVVPALQTWRLAAVLCQMFWHSIEWTIN